MKNSPYCNNKSNDDFDNDDTNKCRNTRSGKGERGIDVCAHIRSAF